MREEGFRAMAVKRFDSESGAKQDYPRPCTKATTLEKVPCEAVYLWVAVVPHSSFISIKFNVVKWRA